MNETSEPIENTPSQEASRSVNKQIKSDHLLQGRDQIEILHRGQVYHLRVTRHGKLILTK